MLEQPHAVPTIQARPHLGAARSTDFEVIATLFAELHGYNASLDERFALAANWREILREHFQRTCHLPSSLWLLAWVGDIPVGLLILENHVDSPLFRHHSWVELVALYVRPSYRGTGLAQQIMHVVCEWASLRGTARMQLYVTTSNARAKAFYRSFGWKPVQEIWRLELPFPQEAQ